MELPYIAKMQKKDKNLTCNSKYEEAVIENTEVFTYEGKNYVPLALRDQVIA